MLFNIVYRYTSMEGGTDGARATVLRRRRLRRRLLLTARRTTAADCSGRPLDVHPDLGLLFYNTACCESVAREVEGALGHLGRAIELWEGCRGLAREDSDFDPIRDDAAFVFLLDSAEPLRGLRAEGRRAAQCISLDAATERRQRRPETAGGERYARSDTARKLGIDEDELRTDAWKVVDASADAAGRRRHTSTVGR